ncbi:MAG: exonuclease [Cyanobacteria bacterium RYN_339]|nr:exonuclease [Cyanobacteria bacterium RYN_339]
MGLYLDVEATYQGKLTVIGLHHSAIGTVQLVGPECTRENLEKILPPAICIYTFDGERFDLSLIKNQLGVDLANRFHSVDLQKTCQRLRLYGGLKRVEQILGIKRQFADMSGKDAVALWYIYERDGDDEALQKLLAYNREDVENLVQLREALESRTGR